MRRQDVLALAALAALGCGSGDSGGSPPALSLSRWLGREPPEAPPRAPAPPREALPPLVTLAGESRGLAEVRTGTRIFARAPRVWIHERPSETSPKMGYLRAGAVTSAEREPQGSGCAGGWYALSPRGYACAGSGVTLEETDPVVRALGAVPPEPRRKLPYIYGTVRKPGPVYARLPTVAELAETEAGIDRRMERWITADGEVGASYAQFVWLGRPGEPPDPAAAWRDRTTAGVPAFLLGGADAPNVHQRPREARQLVIDRMRPKVGYSFTETFLWEGRRYGVTPDLEILPTDRLRPIQGSEFHGVEIGRGVSLPLAFVRNPKARYLVYRRETNATERGPVAPYREPVALTGRQQFFRDVLHYETKDGLWLGDRDASRLDPVKKVPGWAAKGEKWIDVNITKQTLVLYEGTRPVYATLISSGEAGLSDSSSTTATRRGIFRIHSKHVSTTMASDDVGEEFELRDVPYVQYFDDGGHAIHGAYWHDRFGVPKSHGCINLAPEDARRIFYFTEPNVPDRWHGAMDPLRGTVVFIHS